MLHGGPQCSGLSLEIKKINKNKSFSPVSCQAASFSFEAISEAGTPLSAGREARRSGWMGLLRCHLFSLQPLGGWMCGERERERELEYSGPWWLCCTAAPSAWRCSHENQTHLRRRWEGVVKIKIKKYICIYMIGQLFVYRDAEHIHDLKNKHSCLINQEDNKFIAILGQDIWLDIKYD